MPDFIWVEITSDEAVVKLKAGSMTLLPLSCMQNRYYGTGRFPEIKLDVVKNQFYSNGGDI